MSAPDKSRFQAIKDGVFWGTTPISREAARQNLDLFLDNGAVRRYWDLHDAMVEAGYIPARPAPAVPDFTYRHLPAEPFTSERISA
jgi:hypothetical protein